MSTPMLTLFKRLKCVWAPRVIETILVLGTKMMRTQYWLPPPPLRAFLDPLRPLLVPCAHHDTPQTILASQSVTKKELYGIACVAICNPMSNTMNFVCCGSCSNCYHFSCLSLKEKKQDCDSTAFVCAHCVRFRHRLLGRNAETRRHENLQAFSLLELRGFCDAEQLVRYYHVTTVVTTTSPPHHYQSYQAVGLINNASALVGRWGMVTRYDLAPSLHSRNRVGYMPNRSDGPYMMSDACPIVRTGHVHRP